MCLVGSPSFHLGLRVSGLGFGVGFGRVPLLPPSILPPLGSPLKVVGEPMSSTLTLRVHVPCFYILGPQSPCIEST